MKSKSVWLLSLIALFVLISACAPSTQVATTKTGTYCAGSLSAVNQVVWDPIAVTRTTDTYTLVNTTSPVFGLDYPYGTGSHSTWPSSLFEIAGQQPMQVEANGDTTMGGDGQLYSEPANDPTYDTLARLYIAQGTIYYKWELRGATWQSKGNSLVCSGGLWSPALYTTTPSLVTEINAASNGPDPWIWPASAKTA